MNQLTPLARDLKIFQDPDLLNKIRAHVSAGGSVITLAELWGVGFHILIGWLRSTDERNKAYEQALRDRKEWALEKVLKELSQIGHNPPDEMVKTSDKIKALELIGRNIAMFTDKVETSGVIKLEDLVVASMKIKEEK